MGGTIDSIIVTSHRSRKMLSLVDLPEMQNPGLTPIDTITSHLINDRSQCLQG
jgi:hypothetical protein